LNSVANEVWALLDGQRTVKDVVSALRGEYEVDEATLAADVEHLLREMQQEGLIVDGKATGGQG